MWVWVCHVCACVCACAWHILLIPISSPELSLVLQVLTREEARQILAARNENNEKQARALYDFEGERKKELTFSKVREHSGSGLCHIDLNCIMFLFLESCVKIAECQNVC